ncbi:hypothetical protein EV183_002427 [Coemansia sp. RSA 2336]|nr:hypothetical protein EV183_002427 [Coemansia sp. RSA 2336]
MDSYTGHSPSESIAPSSPQANAYAAEFARNGNELASNQFESPSKRQRISRACDLCRRKKVKCDGKRPICTHCEAIGNVCTYLDATKKRGPPKGYIDAIENRLLAAENLLKGLVLSDSNAARHVLNALRTSRDNASSLVSSSNGKLFGCISLKELEAQAAASTVNTPDTANAADAGGRAADLEVSCNRYPACPPEAAASAADNASVAEDPNDEHAHLTHLEKGVGHLTLDPTGSLRYLGDSSGWYIINRSLLTSEDSPRLTRGVDGAFRWPPISNYSARDPEPSAGSAYSAQAASLSQSTVSGSENAPSTASAQVGTEQPCAAPVPRNLPPSGKPPLPDSGEQIRMLSLYFRHVHPVFPILCKTYFLEKFFSKAEQPTPALMSAVFAAASTYKYREARTKEDMARVRIQMAVHFQRAKMYLDEQYTLNTIASILTLLLMSVYEQGTMSTRSWLYSGMAIRKAYDLGLHRDVGVAKHERTAVLSYREVETRQRAWWGCYMMDIMVSATLGRPTTIRDFTFDAPYPENYGEDDDELLVDSPTTRDPLSSHMVCPPAQAGDSSSNVQAPRVAERMRDYVALSVGESESGDSDADEPAGHSQQTKPLGVYHLELLHVLGHILTEMYACKPHRGFVTKLCLHDLHSRTDQLITLDHQLRKWKESLPAKLQYSPDDIIATRPPRCVYVALIHLVYYTAMILLHRPFISRLGSPQQPSAHEGDKDSFGMHAENTDPQHADTRSSSREGSRFASARSSASASPLPSHSICTISAQMISLIGQAIIQDSRIFIMPFLTFMMFTAGTMHLNNVIVAAEGWIARRFLKRTLNVMSRLGAHWGVSYKCYTMLSALVRANRIGLDNVVDDSETGIRIIKERTDEISRISQLVYEARILRHERYNRSDKGKAAWVPTASKKPEQFSGEADGGLQRQAATVATEQIANVSNIPESKRRHSLQPHIGTQTSNAHAMAESGSGAGVDTSRTGASLQGPGKSPIGTKIFALRDKLDRHGRPIVPASPYTSVSFSTQEGNQLGSLDAHTVSNVLTSANSAAPLLAGSAPGQFVSSLEFFANADFPLGIGGPNGQASTMVSQTIAVHGDGTPIVGSSSPQMLQDTSLLATTQQRTAHSSNRSAGISSAATFSSQSTPIGGTMAAGEPVPAQGGIDGVFIDDDIIRNLPFTGPVSCDLGLDGLSRQGEGRPAQQPAAGQMGYSQQAVLEPAAGTPWNDYVNQLIRMFNDSAQ